MMAAPSALKHAERLPRPIGRTRAGRELRVSSSSKKKKFDKNGGTGHALICGCRDFFLFLVYGNNS